MRTTHHPRPASRASGRTAAVEPRRRQQVAEATRVQQALATDPAFGVLTIDGLGWIDPYTGAVVPSPRGHLATARDHLMRTRPWVAGTPKPLAELQVLRWLHFLEATVRSDGRLRGFRRGSGQWLNPYTGGWHPLALDGGRLTRKSLRAMAEILSACPEAQSGRMLDAGRLAELAMGLPPSPPLVAAGAPTPVGAATTGAQRVVSATAVAAAIVEAEPVAVPMVQAEADIDRIRTPLPGVVNGPPRPSRPGRPPTAAPRRAPGDDDLVDRLRTPPHGVDPAVETDPLGTRAAAQAAPAPRPAAPAPRALAEEAFDRLPTPLPGGDPSAETDALGSVIAEANAAFAPSPTPRAEDSALVALELISTPILSPLASPSATSGAPTAEDEAEDLAAWLDQVSTTAVRARGATTGRQPAAGPLSPELSDALEPRRPAAAAPAAPAPADAGTATADLEPHADPRHATTAAFAKPAAAAVAPAPPGPAARAPATARSVSGAAEPAPAAPCAARPPRAIIESSAEIIAVMPLAAVPGASPEAAARNATAPTGGAGRAQAADAVDTATTADAAGGAAAAAAAALPAADRVAAAPAPDVPIAAPAGVRADAPTAAADAPTAAADATAVAGSAPTAMQPVSARTQQPITVTVARRAGSAAAAPGADPPAASAPPHAADAGVLHRSLLARAHAAADALCRKARGEAPRPAADGDASQRLRRTLARLRRGAPQVPGHDLAVHLAAGGFAEVLRRDDGRWLLAAGLASGADDGLPLQIAAVQGLRVLADDGRELDSFASDLADLLGRELAGGATLALSLVLYDGESRRIDCLGAGLPPVLVASRRRRAAVQQPGQAGPAVGAVPIDGLRAHLRPTRFQLTAGDVLVQIAAALDDALLLRLMAGLVANLDAGVAELPDRLIATAGRLGDRPLPPVTMLAFAS